MQLPTLAACTLGLAALASAWDQNPAQIIAEIAPPSKSCDAANKECRTAQQAAPHIFKSMKDYGFHSPNQIAAIISVMAYESADFAYKTNQVPGRPGQGTANMQMAEFNLKYAQSIDAVKGKVGNVQSTDGLADAELNRIRGLVTPDEYNFGSGAWFLKTQCGPEVAQQLATNIDTGFTAYMSCVGVTPDEGRLAYLTRAKTAFGLN